VHAVYPNEPPMPGKITARHTMCLAEALARGTPDKKIMQTIFEEKVWELV
jgi:hypothetical protein